MSDEHDSGQGNQPTEEEIRNMSPEQIKELQKKNCIFCHIIAGRVQSRKIFEDDKSLAILDINPANPGHVLLMPKQHFTIMPQMPDDELGHIFMAAKSISHACLGALKAEGTNIFVANGIAAGQRSPHFMVHIVPRKTNDGVSNFGLVRRKIDRKELAPLRNAILRKAKETMPDNAAILEEEVAVAQSNVQIEPSTQPNKSDDTVQPKKDTKKEAKNSDISIDEIAKVLMKK